jgi:hypothetical protein
LVEVALEILQLNFTWTSASIYRISFSNEASSGVDPPLVPEPGGAASLSEKVEYGIQIRDNLVKILTEYVATSNDDVNEAIKRAVSSVMCLSFAQQAKRTTSGLPCMSKTLSFTTDGCVLPVLRCLW